MPRLIVHSASPDPLQRRPAIAVAGHRSGHPHSLRSGISAILPRLAFVFVTAGAIQLLMHWFSR